jgi:hypothetical protein
VVEKQTFKSLSWWENKLSKRTLFVHEEYHTPVAPGKTDFQKPIVVENRLSKACRGGKHTLSKACRGGKHTLSKACRGGKKVMTGF